MRVKITAIADESRIKECIVLSGLNCPGISFQFAMRHTTADSTFIRWQRFPIQDLYDIKYASGGSVVFEYDWNNLKTLPNWNCAEIHWIYGELTFEKVKEPKRCKTCYRIKH